MRDRSVARTKHLRQACVIGLLAVTVAGLSGCGSTSGKGTAVNSENGGADQASAPADGGKENGRKLTVVKEPQKGSNQGQDLAVAKIHRLENASLEQWLSADEARITTTRMVKAATQTKEPEYAYTTSTVDLATGEQSAETPLNGGPAKGQTVKEQLSPDGKFSFIQNWVNKYKADNKLKNLVTGESTVIQKDNYMEVGAWLNKDTYILAAGSSSGARGDLLAVSTNGETAKLPLEDADLEFFSLLDASEGHIYYTDNKQVLKRVEPGQSKPETVLNHVGNFTVSPDKQWIAVETLAGGGESGSELRIVDPRGNAQGTVIAKGDLLPYMAWSPDSSKLAIAVYTEDLNGMNGVYIFDSSSGKVSLIGPKVFPQYPLSWNPSGTRLAITFNGRQDQMVTQIIDFK